MNHYGRILAEHLRHYRPSEWAALTQYEINGQGEAIAHQVRQLRDTLLEGRARSTEPQKRAVEENQATAQAEEIVLADWLLPPEAGSRWDPARDEQDIGDPLSALAVQWGWEDHLARQAYLDEIDRAEEAEQGP